MKRASSVLLAALLIFTILGTTACASKSSLTSMKAYPQNLQLKAGDKSHIKLALTPSGASSSDIMWVSSNKEIASVDSKGNVTGRSEGTCTITAASKTQSSVSSDIQVTVSAGAEQSATSASGDNSNLSFVFPSADSSQVYPDFQMSDDDISDMDVEEVQFLINQIYAKNGYIFKTPSIQEYFSQMNWYAPVSGNASDLRMSSVDQKNIALLVSLRSELKESGHTYTDLGWLWSYYAVQSRLSRDYVEELSPYDIQLLINTIYAKNGYIFKTESIQNLFESQPWYSADTSDTRDLQFSSTDKANLTLLSSFQ